MSRRKKLNIITTDSNLAVKDHVESKTQGLHKNEMQGGVSSSQEFQSTNEQGGNMQVSEHNRGAKPYHIHEPALVQLRPLGPHPAMRINLEDPCMQTTPRPNPQRTEKPVKTPITKQIQATPVATHSPAQASIPRPVTAPVQTPNSWNVTHTQHNISPPHLEAPLDEVHQGAVAKQKNKHQSLTIEANEYENSRQLRIQENRKRLQELGVKNIVQSLTSLTHNQTLKKKTLKQNCHTGDTDYIPESGDDIQVGRSVASKKQHPPKYIPPMSINRVANLRKLCRVFASNSTQDVPSTSNATKQSFNETIEGDKRRAKRRMVLIDEADDEDDEIFEEGNRLDMEVDDFHHDYEYENMDDTVHTNNRFDAEMIDHDNLQQQIQHPDNKKATGYDLNLSFHTQKAGIWKMVSNERILVMFNKFGKPVGDEGKELVQYLGTLVRMPEHVSIEYSDWRKVPMQHKEDMYSLVKSKFSFHQGETSEIKKWILYSMGKKWRTWKGVLKSRGYDPSLTIDEIVTQQINDDDRVNPTQFKELVKRWFTPEFQISSIEYYELVSFWK
ncbi:hypothetical protein E3N88_06761 [Mikania micrantha]|uniref:Uncharacterized protein n=1 Tax=Mikania micrantha TaxID=192012 RepID=A0A5N6PRP5_9ASTR|nr:hypothetical protein E3N88_06761 [Mikania micrantha]